ncbi:enoyl-CoA hydratase/isomerase family protein [Chloroflexota bacterium]
MKLDTENRFYKYPLKVKGPEDYQGIIYDRGVVTRIILNRPRYLNALSHAVWAEVDDAFDRAGDDKECNVIVLSGNGHCFASGDDVIGMSPEGAPMLVDRRPVEQLIKDYGSEDEVWHQYNIEHDHLITYIANHKIRTNPKPTIALVHGWCIYGGYIMSTACDLVFAAEDALLLAGGGGEWWDIGRRKAMELIMEHRFLTAREAQEIGLVNRVFPDYETLEREGLAFAYRAAYESPAKVRRDKMHLLQQMDIVGYTTAHETLRTPFFQRWREWASDGRIRYEGMGIARTPVALRCLTAKLESEGKEVPENVKAAIARAKERDDRAKWQKALHQDWRDPKRTGRTDAQVNIYDDFRKAFDEKVDKELERRGLKLEQLNIPMRA